MKPQVQRPAIRVIKDGGAVIEHMAISDRASEATKSPDAQSRSFVNDVKNQKISFKSSSSDETVYQGFQNNVKSYSRM